MGVGITYIYFCLQHLAFPTPPMLFNQGNRPELSRNLRKHAPAGPRTCLRTSLLPWKVNGQMLSTDLDFLPINQNSPWNPGIYVITGTQFFVWATCKFPEHFFLCFCFPLNFWIVEATPLLTTKSRQMKVLVLVQHFSVDSQGHCTDIYLPFAVSQSMLVCLKALRSPAIRNPFGFALHSK